MKPLSQKKGKFIEHLFGELKVYLISCSLTSNAVKQSSFLRLANDGTEMKLGGVKGPVLIPAPDRRLTWALCQPLQPTDLAYRDFRSS